MSASSMPRPPGAPGDFAFTPGGAPKPAEPESPRLADPAAAAGLSVQPSTSIPARRLAVADTNKAAEAEKKDADKERNASAMPPSLYFNPNLITDANGDVAIRFKMTTVPSEYRLLIDALGNGRIGSRQELISTDAK